MVLCFILKNIKKKYCSNVCENKYRWRNRSDIQKEQKKISDKKYAQSEKGKISHKKANKKYRDNNKDYYRLKIKEWLKTEKGKEYKKEKDRRYRLKNHDKIIKKTAYLGEKQIYE